MIAFEQRASTVLFNLLGSHQITGPFLLPANICPVVPLVFLKANRAFEFIDIAPDTLCMSHEGVIKRWLALDRAAPAGIIYVRTYGAVFDAKKLFRRIKAMSPGALIVDDRCLCEPTFNGKLESCVDVELYSSGYAKFVDIGFGGFGFIRDGVPYSRAGLPYDKGDLEDLTLSYKRVLEMRLPYVYTDSSWLDTSDPLCSWEDFKRHVASEVVKVRKIKREINLIYARRLPKDIQFPEAFNSWRFNILVRNKTGVCGAIQQEGLFASGHYEPLVDVFGMGEGRRARFLHKHVVNLFNDRYFSLEQAERLVDVLLDCGALEMRGKFW